ncbi:MAG: hypothetical protein Q7K43_06120, partial [Candidatus Woesearchaeota archaeon]|nr:hypothetical protein [Candidatus Woesearchaeota archaeon]
LLFQHSMHKAVVCLSNPLGMPTAVATLYLLIALPYLQQFFIAAPIVILLSLTLHTLLNYPVTH